MIDFGYNNRWIRLVKDILFVLLGGWLIWRGRVFGALVGIFALAWYGRDAYYQAKVLGQEKHYKAPETGPKPAAAPKDDKITVTNLSDAKEVNFIKETEDSSLRSE